MNERRFQLSDPEIEATLDELKRSIEAHAPGTRFEAIQGLGEDQDGIYLMATIDREDPFAVMDVIGERLTQLELDEGLPIYVLPLRTPERIAAELATHDRHGRTALPQP